MTTEHGAQKKNRKQPLSMRITIEQAVNFVYWFQEQAERDFKETPSHFEHYPKGMIGQQLLNWLENHPPTTGLQLEPKIWKDECDHEYHAVIPPGMAKCIKCGAYSP